MEPSRISVDEVKRRIDSGEQIHFIDARGEDAWKSSEVQTGDAIRVPADAVQAHLHEIPKDGLTVAYCT